VSLVTSSDARLMGDIEKLLKKKVNVEVFGVLWVIGARAGYRPGWVLAAGLLAYGIAIELAQGLTTYRDASAADVLADLAGIALAAWWLRRRAT
jgi:VanZ family protein